LGNFIYSGKDDGLYGEEVENISHPGKGFLAVRYK